jgi:hypothetical protein
VIGELLISPIYSGNWRFWRFGKPLNTEVVS